MILTLRTDKPEAEIGLYANQQKLVYKTWQGHRQLAETIHDRIQKMLDEQHKTWQDITGVVIFKGPGSFTGLRIGMSIANALAFGLDVPVVAAAGKDWIGDGIKMIHSGQRHAFAVPDYGTAPNITTPQK